LHCSTTALHPIVVDKTRELAEVGGPLGTSPQTLRLFGQWGILEQLDAISSATAYFETRDQRGELEQITTVPTSVGQDSSTAVMSVCEKSSPMKSNGSPATSAKAYE
jgi:2-polyprenyl-6-methoxyphenol hydroxylase-like FAD-dependent oxidoreductase